MVKAEVAGYSIVKVVCETGMLRVDREREVVASSGICGGSEVVVFAEVKGEAEWQVGGRK